MVKMNWKKFLIRAHHINQSKHDKSTHACSQKELQPTTTKLQQSLYNKHNWWADANGGMCTPAANVRSKEEFQKLGRKQSTISPETGATFSVAPTSSPHFWALPAVGGRASSSEPAPRGSAPSWVVRGRGGRPGPPHRSGWEPRCPA